MKPYLIAGFIAVVLSGCAMAKQPLGVGSRGNTAQARHSPHCEAIWQQFFREYDVMASALRDTRNNNFQAARTKLVTLHSMSQQLFNERCVSLKTWTVFSESFAEIEQELKKVQSKNNHKDTAFYGLKRKQFFKGEI